jgi:hypothetical protein
MSNLPSEQAAMKERWKGARKIKKPGKPVRIITAEQAERDEVAELASRTDLICPACKDNPTRASKVTGEILLCKSCVARKPHLVKYGLTLKKYFAIIASQGGRCAVCFERMEKPFVDHCHEGLHVRGIVCHNCNTLLGHAKDDEHILKNAIKYLINNRVNRRWAASEPPEDSYRV